MTKVDGIGMATIYGIRNCDTMKKALHWLAERKIDFTFHDYKKEGVPGDVIEQAIAAHGWDNVINRRGTTWQQLPSSLKDRMDGKSAVRAALENPSLVKRPLLHHKGKIHIGFKPELYEEIFG